jgi:hypothetical protein
VHVVDPLRELLGERRRVEELVDEVARVEVDPEALTVADRVERLRGRDEVVRDLRRVHLEREADALVLEHVDDRAPALREVLVAALDLVEVVRREGVELVPDRRAGEAVDDADAELGGRAGRVLHAIGRAPADALGLAVAPDVGREDRAVPLVDRVADGLADEMRPDREALEPVPPEQLAPAVRVAGLRDRAVDLEVVAPARELEPVEPPSGRLRRELVQGQVRPLAREECHRTSHRLSLGSVARRIPRGSIPCSRATCDTQHGQGRDASRLAYAR